jgi:hypothetical protein
MIHTEVGDRYELLRALNLADKACMEVGVYDGHFANAIAKQRPSTLYLVDPWDMNTPRWPWAGEKGHLSVRMLFKDNRAVKIIRKSSFEAAISFPDGELDFIYIDANHSTAFFYADLFLWYPKIKTGGWLSGHDYGHPDYRIDRDLEMFSKVTGEELAYLTKCDVMYETHNLKKPVGSWAIRKTR